MCDTSDILNLQYFKRESYISVICQASVCSGRQKSRCGHPPSRRQESKYGKRHFGGYIRTKDEGSRMSGCFFMRRPQHLTKKLLNTLLEMISDTYYNLCIKLINKHLKISVEICYYLVENIIYEIRQDALQDGKPTYADFRRQCIFF